MDFIINNNVKYCNKCDEGLKTILKANKLVMKSKVHICSECLNLCCGITMDNKELIEHIQNYTCKDVLLIKYQEIQSKAIKAKNERNIPMYEIYNNKLKTIRMTLSLLKIHIEGIN